MGDNDTAKGLFPHLIDIYENNFNFHKICSLYTSKSLSNNYEKEGMMFRPVWALVELYILWKESWQGKNTFLVYTPQRALHDRPYTHFGCLCKYLIDILQCYIASDMFLATSSSRWVPYIAKTVP